MAGYTVAQVAARLGLGERTVRRRAEAAGAERIGRDWIFSDAAVEALGAAMASDSKRGPKAASLKAERASSKPAASKIASARYYAKASEYTGAAADAPTLYPAIKVTYEAGHWRWIYHRKGSSQFSRLKALARAGRKLEAEASHG